MKVVLNWWQGLEEGESVNTACLTLVQRSVELFITSCFNLAFNVVPTNAAKLTILKQRALTVPKWSWLEKSKASFTF